MLQPAGRAFALEAVRKSGDGEVKMWMKANGSGNPQMLREGLPLELSVLEPGLLWNVV